MTDAQNLPADDFPADWPERPCGHKTCPVSDCAQTPEFRAWLTRLAYEQG